MAELTLQMNLKGIELPIYHEPEESESLADLGIKSNITDCVTKRMTFYNIEAIGTYTEEDRDMSVVFSNWMDFICPWGYERLKKFVEGYEHN